MLSEVFHGGVGSNVDVVTAMGLGCLKVGFHGDFLSMFDGVVKVGYHTVCEEDEWWFSWWDVCHGWQCEDVVRVEVDGVLSTLEGCCGGCCGDEVDLRWVMVVVWVLDV